MAGYSVNRSILDQKSAEAVIALRTAFRKAEAIAAWLANNPSSGGEDPLVTEMAYTADEAYVLRVFFETLNTTRINLAGTFEIGRQITGLE